MIRDKKMDRICIAAIIVALVFSLCLTVGCVLFAEKPQPTDKTQYLSTEYVNKIFDDSYVHVIDIRLPEVNWDYLVTHALEEQYVLCTAVIDGESFENIAIRPKGNSSLKAIKTTGSDRFSFKLEFDHYRDENTYYGLDKLALNNLGQDVSCMKDYLTYHMMNEIGIAAPLSSFTQLKLNGEDFGLYLAIGLVMLKFANRSGKENPYILIVHLESSDVENIVMELITKNTERSLLKGKTFSKDGREELTVEVQLKSGESGFVKEINEIELVNDVVMVSYNGDYMQ